jgi:hypothetical protein
VYADRLLLPWLDCLRPGIPGLAIFDAHTHIGAADPDGARCSAEQLLETVALAQARAVAFPLMEPGGYRRANDHVLAEAARSQERLVPFCRVDPNHDPVGEAERCLAVGAAGIKLHPRAENFTLADPGVQAIAALAHERRLPILVHAGRGIPTLGRDALDLCAAYPQARIVLAHAAICDLAWIWRPARDQPNLFSDTAWWSPADLLTLLTLVPPGQILLGSDVPYNTTATAATVAIRCALQAGLGPEQIVRIAGGQLRQLLAGEDPLDVGAPPTEPAPPPGPLLERVFVLLAAALGRMMQGQPGAELLELARLGCQVDPDEPDATILASVAELLDRRTRYASTAAPLDGPRTSGFHLVAVAAALARTPTAPQPALSLDSDGL